MSLAIIGSLAGGIGLFLLGMRLMTEGLKLAAGSALTRILERWTRSAFRGLLSGMFITSVVQSSSAVTVAIIGFVNAGLMTLTQAIWVIYGSNIGTTMTGWLVAIVGFEVNIKANVSISSVTSTASRCSARAHRGDCRPPACRGEPRVISVG